MAAALADPSPSSARELTDQAVATAMQAGAGFSTWRLLVEVAAELAQHGPGLALHVAKVIDDPEYRASALADVAEVHAVRARDRPTAVDRQPGTEVMEDLLVVLRAMAPQAGREAWWRFAQLAVVLAADVNERHDLVKAVLDARW